ncbi:MAG: hypothetical protein ACK41T_11765 [Pseudobdellovibrio sp.]
MSINPLPPQAYTKETLQKAYAWLLTQNASVKEMAQDQNILVSLYLKAQRNGEASLEAPSIQNFKQELKSLANMMGSFHSPAQSPSHSPIHNVQATRLESPQPTPHQQDVQFHQQPLYQPPSAPQTTYTGNPYAASAQQHHSSYNQASYATQPPTAAVSLSAQAAASAAASFTHQSTTTTTTSQTMRAAATADINFTFDARTQEAIKLVRETLNLGSDAEAIRALVAIGIKQFQKMNP